MKSGLSQWKIAPREGPGVNCVFLDKHALFWTNSATSSAAICALMRTRAKSAVSAPSVLPPNQGGTISRNFQRYKSAIFCLAPNLHVAKEYVPDILVPEVVL